MSVFVDRLIRDHGYPVASSENIEDLIAHQECLVLFFANEPNRYPESNDVAVILPELHKAFADRFAVAVVARESEAALQERFPFPQWPALVFLRRGVQVGAICKVRDWSEYRASIADMLADSGEGQQIPSINL